MSAPNKKKTQCRICKRLLERISWRNRHVPLSPKERRKRISEGMRLYWAERKRRESEEATRSTLKQFESSMFYGNITTSRERQPPPSR